MTLTLTYFMFFYIQFIVHHLHLWPTNIGIFHCPLFLFPLFRKEKVKFPTFLLYFCSVFLFPIFIQHLKILNLIWLANYQFSNKKRFVGKSTIFGLQYVRMFIISICRNVELFFFTERFIHQLRNSGYFLGRKCSLLLVTKTNKCLDSKAYCLLSLTFKKSDLKWYFWKTLVCLHNQ